MEPFKDIFLRLKSSSYISLKILLNSSHLLKWSQLRMSWKDPGVTIKFLSEVFQVKVLYFACQVSGL